MTALRRASSSIGKPSGASAPDKALFRPKKAAALRVIVRERPAFRSAFAKHALNRGRGIFLARWRHKSLLRKGGGDGAAGAAVIQDLGSDHQFGRTLCKTLAPSALALSGSLALPGVDADRPQLEAAPRMFSEPVN